MGRISSDNQYLWRADPCFTMRSLQVLRSSTLLPSVRSVDWISKLRQPPPCPEEGGTAGQSSPESSGGREWVREYDQNQINTWGGNALHTKTNKPPLHSSACHGLQRIFIFSNVLVFPSHQILPACGRPLPWRAPEQ